MHLLIFIFSLYVLIRIESLILYLAKIDGRTNLSIMKMLLRIPRTTQSEKRCASHMGIYSSNTHGLHRMLPRGRFIGFLSWFGASIDNINKAGHHCEELAPEDSIG